MVANFNIELGLRRGWIWIECYLLAQEFIPGVECHRQADQQGSFDFGCMPSCRVGHCNQLSILCTWKPSEEG